MEKKTSYFSTLNMLHKALLAGQLAFAGIAFYLVYTKSFLPVYSEEENQTVILIGLAVFCAVIVLLSFSLYRNRIMLIRDTGKNVTEKLSAYRVVNLTRWAMIEGPVLVAVIAVMLTGNMTIYVLVIAMLLLFILSGPTVSKAAIETGLPEDIILNA